MTIARPNVEPAPNVNVRQHCSALGQWTVTTLRPHRVLDGVVRYLWQGEGRVAYARDRILPSAQSYLLINLGAPQYVVDPGPPFVRRPFDDVWFCGIAEQPIDAEAPNGSVVVGIEFTTTGAGMVLPWQQAELANYVGPLGDIIGRELSQLRERLLNTQGAAARLLLVHDWLLDKCVSGHQVHPLVKWATRQLAESRGGLRAAALADAAGCSRKHLVNLFNRDVGLAPKTLARVHRFHRVLDELRAGSSRAWPDIALDCGYYDQSHLIRDFRQFSGMSPNAFVQLPMPDPKSVVVK